MGKAARSVRIPRMIAPPATPAPGAGAPLLDSPLLDLPLAFFSSTREGWCQLQLFAPPAGRGEGQGPALWTAHLSQEDETQGWALSQGIEAAVRAAWETLSRLRCGDWPLPGDARLDALPDQPGDLIWIEHLDERHFRRVQFPWDGPTPHGGVKGCGEHWNSKRQ